MTAQLPDEESLQLKDDEDVLEAKSLDELAVRLRERYPDDKYERTIHKQLDQQRTDAWRGLGQQIVECFVNGLSQDAASEFGRWTFRVRVVRTASLPPSYAGSASGTLTFVATMRRLESPRWQVVFAGMEFGVRDEAAREVFPRAFASGEATKRFLSAED